MALSERMRWGLVAIGAAAMNRLRCLLICCLLAKYISRRRATPLQAEPLQNLLGDVGSEKVAPGFYGGVSWSPGAFSPQTGYAYATATHMPTWFESLAEVWGFLVAVDPLSGEIVWRYKTDHPMIGGVLATAGGLVFAGRTGGSFGAWDAFDGELLWEFPARAGCNAAPATFMSDSRQFIVVACGGNHTMNRLGMTPLDDEVLAFALPY